MKFNKAVTICLLLAVLLVGGAFFASAAGFVTYEDNNKIILWDNVKLVNQGLNFPSTAVIEGGNINLGAGKDLFIRKFIGFDCPANYPTNLICATTIGDIGGNTFLKINEISGQNLTLSAEKSSINLSGVSVDLGSADKNVNLILAGNLILTDNLPLPLATNSIFVDYLKTNVIAGASLTIPRLKLSQGAFFITSKAINYTP